MTNPYFALQSAMVSEIVADATLITILGSPPRVYDEAPPNTSMPYVIIDEPQVAEWDVTPTESDSGFGHEHTVMLHAWSAYEGKKEINSILWRLEQIFRAWAPALTSWRLVNIRFQFSDRLRDPDGQAWHGIIQFRLITEEI